MSRETDSKNATKAAQTAQLTESCLGKQQSVDSSVNAVSKAISKRLEELGWTICSQESAFARKSFDTAVGEKVASVYLRVFATSEKVASANQRAFSTPYFKLSCSYFSEGRNILEPMAALGEIPIMESSENHLSCIDGLDWNINSCINNSYARKLIARP